MHAMTRIGRTAALAGIAGLAAGCANFGSLVSTNWSENYARAELGTSASDERLIDGDMESVGRTEAKADPREFLLEFPEPRRVRRIRIVNDNLYRFALDYWDAEKGGWRNVKTVWQRRDVEGEERRIQPVYDITGINFTTQKVRITVSRTVDDMIVSKTVPEKDDKILDRVRRVVGGTWIEYYRVIVERPARIREIEAYGVLPNKAS